MTAHDDRARDEQPATTETWWRHWPPGGELRIGRQEQPAPAGDDVRNYQIRDPRLVRQPAPAGDNELREAERARALLTSAAECRELAVLPSAEAREFLAEYDERGRELERAQAEAIRLRARVAELEPIETRAREVWDRDVHVEGSRPAARYILGRSS